MIGRTVISAVLFLSLFFHSAAAAQTGAPEEQTVTAWGEAALSEDALADRDRAITKAQRKALEDVVGVYISSSTLVSNFEVVDDRILTNSDGYINNYEMIQEKRGKTHRVQIRATVGLVPVTDTLRSSGLLRNWRVGVMLEPDRFAYRQMLVWYSKAQLLSISRGVETEIGRAMAGAGFKVVDPRYLKGLSAANVDTANIPATVAQHADLLITGSVSVSSRKSMGNIEQSVCQVQGRVLRVDTGEIIFQGNIGNTYDGKTLLVSKAVAEKFMDTLGNGQLSDGSPDLRTYGRDAVDAIDRAVRLASALAADEIVSQISRIPASVQSVVVVEASGLDFDQLVRLEDAISRFDGVRSVNTESVGDTVQSMEVIYDGSAMSLAKSISRSTTARQMGLKIRKVTKSKITLGRK